MYNWQSCTIRLGMLKEKWYESVERIIVERLQVCKPIGWDPTLRQEGNGSFPHLAWNSIVLCGTRNKPAQMISYSILELGVGVSKKNLEERGLSACLNL